MTDKTIGLLLTTYRMNTPLDLAVPARGYHRRVPQCATRLCPVHPSPSPTKPTTNFSVQSDPAASSTHDVSCSINIRNALPEADANSRRRTQHSSRRKRRIYLTVYLPSTGTWKSGAIRRGLYITESRPALSWAFLRKCPGS